ncbi:MAG: hypothetical protein F4187_07240 [Gemmatimonadetes bacterium]|nr:hypothetical protein [Gemmatimonadota bacterium]
MGVKRPWLTWLLLAGLVAVYAGARVFAGMEYLRIGLIVAGVAAVGAAKAMRAAYWRKASDDARSMETILFLCYAGAALALAGFLTACGLGVVLLGLEFEDSWSEQRFQRFFLTASSVLLVCSLLPALGAQWALAKGGHAGVLRVDALRVRQTAAGGLSVALAAVALTLIGYVAATFDRAADFTYNRTAMPGSSVREIVLSMDEPLRVALFFPDVHPIKDEVLVYVNELARITGRVVIEEYDRFHDPAGAEEYEARGDGMVYFRKGDAYERIVLGMDMEQARPQLRVLDSIVQGRLLLLNRERRTVYLTTGHGELNDPLAGEYPGSGPVPDPGEFGPGLLPLQGRRQFLGLLNYDIRDLGVGNGLAEAVPDDAAMLMILGPRRPFLEAEIDAVRDYLDRGGSLVLALETGTEFTMAGLRDHLGVDFDPAMVLDDQQGMSNDPRVLMTSRFSMHPAVTTPSRESIGQSVMMAGTGSFTQAEDVPGVQTEAIVESPLSSYADLNGNLAFDDDTEEQRNHFLAIAVERTDGAGAAGAEDERGMRALLYGDAEIFSDQWIGAGLNTVLIGDGLFWLHREENLAGEVISEEDVPVLHTRAENVLWFYTVIFGAPAVVLGLGLTIIYARRRQGRGAAEAEGS